MKLKKLFTLFIVGFLLLISISACLHAEKFTSRSIDKEFSEYEPIFNGDVYIKMQGKPSNPTIVFIHGLGDEASNIWNSTLEYLKNDYFLITLDLPGFGRSSKMNALYSPENYARLIKHIVDKYVSDSQFHLVGHSMGGAISLKFAATYPENIQTLTLIDAAGILHRVAYTKYLAPLGLKPFAHLIDINKGQVTSFTGGILGKLESYMNLDIKSLLSSKILRAKVLQGKPTIISAMALVLEDFSEIPQRIRVPTLIIWGEDDEVAPLRTGHVLNELIPDSELVVLENVGHVPMIQQTKYFNQVLASGLQLDVKDNSISSVHPSSIKMLSCIDQNHQQYSGTIDMLIIDNCNDVLIHDAKLKYLSINNSRVNIENVDIDANNTALLAVNSSVTITAGKIQGEIAIETQQSNLDIAGTTLVGKKNVVFVPATTLATNIIFSLTLAINQSNGQKEVLHKHVIVNPGEGLFRD